MLMGAIRAGAMSMITRISISMITIRFIVHHRTGFFTALVPLRTDHFRRLHLHQS